MKNNQEEENLMLSLLNDKKKAKKQIEKDFDKHIINIEKSIAKLEEDSKKVNLNSSIKKRINRCIKDDKELLKIVKASKNSILETYQSQIDKLSLLLNKK